MTIVFALQIRVLLRRTGELRTAHAPTPAVGESTLFPSSIPFAGRFDGVMYRLHLDARATGATPHSVYKTTARAHYDAARGRSGLAGPEAPVDVLIVSEEGRVVETSIFSVYFKRGGRWVTPPVFGGTMAASVCQRGTTRRWAIEKGLVVEEEVDTSSLREREMVAVSNGVRGFCLGTVTLSPKVRTRI